jgi:hypothetical protein
MQRLSDYRHSTHESRLFGKTAAFIGLSKMDTKPALDKLEPDDAREIHAALAAQATKSGIGGVSYGAATETPAFSSVAMGTYEETIVGQIPGKRQLPFFNKIATGAIIGTGSGFRQEGKAIRVAPVSFAGLAMQRNSASGIAVITREFAEIAIRDNTSAETLSRLLTDNLRKEIDSVFCGSSAAVSGVQPEGIAHAAQSVSSTGATAAAIAADIRSMVNVMVGGGVPLRSAVWILSSEAFSLIATSRLVDESGNTIAGCPYVVGAPSGTMLLVASDFLVYAVSDSVSVAISTASMIEMDSSPTGDAVTPTAASANRISLFQNDLIAIKGILDISWALGGPTDSNGSFAAVKLASSSYA